MREWNGWAAVTVLKGCISVGNGGHELEGFNQVNASLNALLIIMPLCDCSDLI